MKALALQISPKAPPDILGEWCARTGGEIEVHRIDLDGAPAEIGGYDLIACLGSRWSPLDDAAEVVAARETVGAAVDAGVPVLGLCFGGQLLAAVLGGEVGRSPEPELGWYEVATEAPELIPSGPWLQWHKMSFEAPPAARVLARSAAGCQAFREGPHLGVQFHPEATPATVLEWARKDHEGLVASGIEDGEDRVLRGVADAPAARLNAFTLFDRFWENAQQGGIR